MMKNIYAHTALTPQFPSYINVSAVPDSDELRVIVRGPAVLVETENGGHYDCGHSSETLLTREHAMDLARSVTKHYAERPITLDPNGDHGIGADLRARFFPDDAAPVEGHRVYEETDTIGAVSHTRRLIIDSMHDPIKGQIARLAEFILTTFEGEPSGDLNEGAVDVAIRLLGDYAAVQKARKFIEENRDAESRNRIASGLRQGRAELNTGDTQNVVVPPPGEIVDVAHAGGLNEPAVASAPLGSLTPRDALERTAAYQAQHVDTMKFYPDERGYDVVTAQPYDDKI